MCIRDRARTFIRRCLNAGKSVVSANKDLIAVHGRELLDAAKENNVDFMFEASCAGGIPIIRSLKQSLVANDITEIMGIVNGTTNYILTKIDVYKRQSLYRRRSLHSSIIIHLCSG